MTNVCRSDRSQCFLKRESGGTTQGATSTNTDRFKRQTAEILGYHDYAVIDKYVIEPSAGKEFLDSDELFARVDDVLRVQLKGLQDQSPNSEVFWQDEGEVSVKWPIPGGDPVYMGVDRITVQEFQGQLSKIYEE